MFIRFPTPSRIKCLPDLREEAAISLPKLKLTPDSDVVYINTTVTGSLMGHQTFQDAQNQVIRQELLVVRVPEMADRRVKEIDSVVRVPVPDHLGPWDSPHQAHLVFERVARLYPNTIKLHLVGPCAPSPTRSPRLFMHGITGAEDHQHIVPNIIKALQDKDLVNLIISFAPEVQYDVTASAFTSLRALTSLKQLTSLQTIDISRVAPNAGSS